MVYILILVDDNKNSNKDMQHMHSSAGFRMCTRCRFFLAFYVVLRPQGIRKQMKTLRKRHRVYIALAIGRVTSEHSGNIFYF